MRYDDVRLFGNPEAEYVFVQLVDEHDSSLMESEAKLLGEMAGGDDWCVAAVPVGDWNADLTPWEAPPVFGKLGFGDGAAATLERIMDTVIPELEKARLGKGRTYAICGYSLAGLFSLWAACQTDAFAAAIAVSPSVWYPGWIDYAREHPTQARAVYLSLGDREARAKNPVMAAVGDAIRRQYDLLTSGGKRCVLEWNPGNHFVDSDRRTAKGLAWALKTLRETDKKA